MGKSTVRRGLFAGLLGVSVVAVAAPVTPSDIRVGPMLQSAWSQTGYRTSRDFDVRNVCYNYYTPNHFACGCVAAAGAQLMRYHRHPVSEVIPGTYECYVWEDAVGQYVPESLTMFGGVYDWDGMPLVPAKGCTPEERETIGRLTYDIAISCGTAFYSQDSSSSFGVLLTKRLVDRFQFANAVGASFASSESIPPLRYAEEFGYTLERFKAAVIPNLDAGLPVLLSLSSKDWGGHVVVCDGYGYEGGKLYVHVNVGWAGYGDGWYVPPNFTPAGYKYDTIDAIIYNIYPTGEAGTSIVSGRVLSRGGRPVSGATVTAVRSEGEEVASVQTNKKGIYALAVPPGEYEIRAAKETLSTKAEVTVGTCVSTVYEDAGWARSSPTPRIGNVFDFNLTFTAGEDPEPEIRAGVKIDEYTALMFAEYVGSAAKGLPSGVKWDKKTGLLSGTPTKPGVYTVTFTLGKAKSYGTMTVLNFVDPEIPVGDAYGPHSVGVIVREDLSAIAADCSVSGLPSGLKFAKKNLVDKTCGSIKKGMIYGVPTKAGAFTVIFTKKIGKVTHKASATFHISALPDWAQGTFDGGSEKGQATFTVSKAGKLSGKWLSDGKTVKLAAPAFEECEGDTYKIGEGFTITKDGANHPDFEAFRNTWKTDRKEEAKKLKGWVPPSQTVEGGTLSFKVGANGTVKVSGVFGKYKASCSATLIPGNEPDSYSIFVYFAPKKNKFDGFSGKINFSNKK